MAGPVKAGVANPSAGTMVRTIWAPDFRWISLGMCSIILLAAFESLAITTVMPAISGDLDGARLYALAFAGPLAVSVVGMVSAGTWSDRRGPRSALYASCALFVVGLLIAGTAQSMPVFVCGRLVHGLGGGGAIVALYVLVARLYPASLQPKIFAAFAAAWVVPSLVGPYLAGLVVERLSWHWVFLGVIAFVVPALAMVVPALRHVRAGDATSSPWRIRPILWSLLCAVGVLAVNLSADWPIVAGWLVPPVALVVTLVALRPLVPPGALVARRGLPSVILLRGLMGTAFFSAEVYLPYLLIDEYGLRPSVAGLALTAGGVSWAFGSWWQGRDTGPLVNRSALRVSAGMVTSAILVMLIMALWSLPVAVAMVAWAFSGLGMGMIYPRLSVLTLSMSDRDSQGFNSSALTVADSIGGAMALAISGLVFAGLTRYGSMWQFAGCFALAAVAGVAAVVATARVAESE